MPGAAADDYNCVEDAQAAKTDWGL